jgi:hypothetical protein
VSLFDESPHDSVHQPARPVATTVEAATRALATLRPTSVAIIDLPLPTALAVVRGASAAAVPPWIVLVVPPLALPATSLPVDDVIRSAPPPRTFDPSWWRGTDRLPEARAVWVVLDGDREAPTTVADRQSKTDAHHEVDPDSLPSAMSLRRAGYESITIIGKRAIPAPDLEDYVETCLTVGMHIRCLMA